MVLLEVVLILKMLRKIRVKNRAKHLQNRTLSRKKKLMSVVIIVHFLNACEFLIFLR